MSNLSMKLFVVTAFVLLSMPGCNKKDDDKSNTNKDKAAAKAQKAAAKTNATNGKANATNGKANATNGKANATNGKAKTDKVAKAATGMTTEDEAAKSAIAAAIAHADRPAADKSRDEARKPGQVLTFFGIKPGMKVAELLSGQGYYAELLARVVGDKGAVYAQNNKWLVDKFGDSKLRDRTKKPGLNNIQVQVAEFDALSFPATLDAVLFILAYHDQYVWKTDRAKMNKAIFDALKPGGVYGIIDHYAENGSGERDAEKLHRGDAEMIKKDILAAGFEFVSESDLLRHPDDKRDKMVFDAAIRGKTDRFIYMFKKPVK